MYITKDSKQINFYLPYEKNGWLSNFFAKKISNVSVPDNLDELGRPVKDCKIIGTFDFKTAEHLFQAMKFSYEGGVEVMKQIMVCDRPKKAYDLSQDKVHKKVRKDWICQGYNKKAMYFVVREKFKDAELKKKLLETGDSNLNEHTEKDKFWGDGGSEGKGKNMLGKILMEIREEINQEVKDKIKSTSTKKLNSVSSLKDVNNNLPEKTKTSVNFKPREADKNNSKLTINGSKRSSFGIVVPEITNGKPSSLPYDQVINNKPKINKDLISDEGANEKDKPLFFVKNDDITSQNDFSVDSSIKIIENTYDINEAKKATRDILNKIYKSNLSWDNLDNINTSRELIDFVKNQVKTSQQEKTQHQVSSKSLKNNFFETPKAFNENSRLFYFLIGGLLTVTVLLTSFMIGKFLT